MRSTAETVYSPEALWAARARQIWLVGWSAPMLIGFLISVLALRPSVAVELMVTTWLLVFGFGVALVLNHSATVHALPMVATATAVLSMSSVGIAILSGPLVVPLVLLSGLSHPTTVHHIRVWLRRRLNMFP